MLSNLSTPFGRSRETAVLIGVRGGRFQVTALDPEVVPSSVGHLFGVADANLLNPSISSPHVARFPLPMSGDYEHVQRISVVISFEMDIPYRHCYEPKLCALRICAPCLCAEYAVNLDGHRLLCRVEVKWPEARRDEKLSRFGMGLREWIHALKFEDRCFFGPSSDQELDSFLVPDPDLNNTGLNWTKTTFHALEARLNDSRIPRHVNVPGQRVIPRPVPYVTIKVTHVSNDEVAAEEEESLEALEEMIEDYGDRTDFIASTTTSAASAPVQQQQLEVPAAARPIQDEVRAVLPNGIVPPDSPSFVPAAVVRLPAAGPSRPVSPGYSPPAARRGRSISQGVARPITRTQPTQWRTVFERQAAMDASFDVDSSSSSGSMS